MLLNVLVHVKPPILTIVLVELVLNIFTQSVLVSSKVLSYEVHEINLLAHKIFSYGSQYKLMYIIAAAPIIVNSLFCVACTDSCTLPAAWGPHSPEGLRV